MLKIRIYFCSFHRRCHISRSLRRSISIPVTPARTHEPSAKGLLHIFANFRFRNFSASILLVLVSFRWFSYFANRRWRPDHHETRIDNICVFVCVHKMKNIVILVHTPTLQTVYYAPFNDASFYMIPFCLRCSDGVVYAKTPATFW